MDLGKITNRQYNVYAEQSLNLASLISGGKFDMMTARDKVMETKKEFERLTKR